MNPVGSLLRVHLRKGTSVRWYDIHPGNANGSTGWCCNRMEATFNEAEVVHRVDLFQQEIAAAVADGWTAVEEGRFVRGPKGLVDAPRELDGES